MRTKLFLKMCLLLSSIVVSVVLAEGFLQVIGKPSPVVSGWVNKGSELQTNQLGFRGHKIKYTDNDYVIVLLGDSQVAASACSFDWLPERRLEDHLNQRAISGNNFKVFSIGADGYGQDQQLLMLQKYYKTYRADLVVLWQTPRNDVWNNVFPTHWPANGWPKPTFRLVNGELQGPSENCGEIANWSKIKLFALANRQFRIVDRDGEWEKYLPQPYEPLRHYEGKASRDWQERWDNNLGFMRGENLDTEKSHLALSLSPVSPRMQYGLDLTKALLTEIRSVTNKNNSRLIIFSTRTEDHKQGNNIDHDVVHVLNGKYYRTSEKQLSDNLEYINANVVSLTVPVTIPKWRVGPENSHLNEHATDQVMNDLAGQILPLLMQEKP